MRSRLAITLLLVACTGLGCKPASSQAPPAAPPRPVEATVRFHVVGMNDETIATQLREAVSKANCVVSVTTSVEDGTFDVEITRVDFAPIVVARTSGLPLTVFDQEVLAPDEDEGEARDGAGP